MAVAEYNPEANVHVFRLESKLPPLRFGIAASNIIHQLRATLDNLVWQLVILNRKEPRGGPRGNSFPILFSDHDHHAFSQSTRNALCGVHPKHRALIEGLQPYKHPAAGQPFGFHPLRLLRELSNEDKHQELKLAVGVHSPGHSLVWQIAGIDHDLIVDRWIDPAPDLKPGAVVGWVETRPAVCHEDMHVQINGAFRMNFRGADHGLVFSLRVLTASVAGIVRAFQPAVVWKPPCAITLSASEVTQLYEASRQTDPLNAQSELFSKAWSQHFPNE